jgi:hypothetical protein
MGLLQLGAEGDTDDTTDEEEQVTS